MRGHLQNRGTVSGEVTPEVIDLAGSSMATLVHAIPAITERTAGP